MTSETLVAPELEAEIEQLKDEIRELYPRSQAMRIEIGAKLLELQAKLAHYGNGTFIQTVVTELHIPKSTCYELMEFARVTGEPDSLSGFETNFEEESVEDTRGRKSPASTGESLPPQDSNPDCRLPRDPRQAQEGGGKGQCCGAGGRPGS